MRSNKRARRIIVRVGKVRLGTNAVEGTKRLNMRKDRNIRKPAVSEENNMIILISKKIDTIRNTRFNKVNRESMRSIGEMKTTKPERNTVVYRYGEKKGRW